MIQGTFNQTEINQALSRIIDLGCDVWIEGTRLRLRGGKNGPEWEEAKGLFRKYHAGLVALLQGQRVNGFAESLEKGNNPIAHTFLDAVYRKAFYNFDQLIRTKNGDTVSQKAGSDVVIWTTANRAYTADEKIRDRADYSDIALEYISNDRVKTPGWMEKDLSIDYLVYAFVPVRRAYLFPWQQLKMAWEKNKANWLLLANDRRDGFTVVSAPNPTYRTLSCAIPTDLLIEKVKESIVIQL
jgi:hypothetical protein